MNSQKEQFYIHRIAELEKQVAELIDKVANLSKNSSRSSKDLPFFPHAEEVFAGIANAAD